MVEKNWRKGALALTLWSPWTATWRWKGLYSGSWAAGLATELPAPELPDCRQDLPPPDLPASAAVQLLEYIRRSSRKASAAVQLPGYNPRAASRTASTAASCQLRRRSGGGSRQSTPAGLPLKLRLQSGGSSSMAGRRPDCRQSGGGRFGAIF